MRPGPRPKGPTAAAVAEATAAAAVAEAAAGNVEHHVRRGAPNAGAPSLFGPRRRRTPMNERSPLEDAFGLRWLQDDDRGRLVYDPGNGDFRSLADAINVLRLGCEEAALQQSLDRFPPHIRIHGGYAPSIGEPVTRFTVTWEPGAAEASYSQTRDGPEEGMSGRVDVPAGGSLKDVLMDLLVPDAQDVIGQARESGKAAAIKDADCWIGDRHFRVAQDDPL